MFKPERPSDAPLNTDLRSCCPRAAGLVVRRKYCPHLGKLTRFVSNLLITAGETAASGDKSPCAAECPIFQRRNHCDDDHLQIYAKTRLEADEPRVTPVSIFDEAPAAR